MKKPKEVDSPKLLLSALMVRAVKDWKRIRAKGVDPNSTTWSQRRAIDHTLDEADLAHLIAFFNCPLVDKALEAIRFPFNLADIRRELEIPTMPSAPPALGLAPPPGRSDVARLPS
jgi:hypothetical protein